MFESWAGTHAELGALAPDQETRLTLTYIAPAGSNNLFVEASLPAFDSVGPALTIPILIDADSDHDGLSDSWEAELGLSSEDPTDVLLDLDGDGTGGTLELGILRPESDTSRLYRVRVRRNR